MYITPNTNVRLLKNIRLDLDYTHSISWQGKTATDMYNYYAGKTKYNLANYSYQRHSKESIKVAINCDLLYDCNYMMFQNSAYGNKWFYAFITDVEYVNDNTSVVYYKIDVIQTWYFETWFEPCFVEREHTRTDNIGDNIQPEPVAFGEYVISDVTGYKAYTPFQNIATMVLVADDAYTYWGNLYDGTYSGCTLFAFLNSHENFLKNISDFIKKYTDEGKPEAIIAMYTCPDYFVKENLSSLTNGWGRVVGFPESERYNFSATPIKSGDALGGGRSLSNKGYVPRNNKMYTYPYNFFHIDNSDGDGLELRYEFFDNLTPSFVCRNTITQPVSITLNPVNYKNSTSYYLPETLALSNYPLCSWIVDSYQAWIAQNAVPTLIKTKDTLIGVGAGALMASNPVTGALGAGLATTALIGNTISKVYSASIKADICKGSTRTNNVNVASKTQNFYGCRMSVNSDDAKTIDDYFTMFGYAINKVKTPSTWNRENYTFIKTIGSQIEGNIPQKDLQEINEIHDRGITYWRNGDIIGDYGVSNNPRG